MAHAAQTAAAFSGCIDLASARLGARIVEVSDEFFAEAKNLLEPEPPMFIPEKFTERGKWMDGWESRRRRRPGHDCVTIRLGLAGAIHGFDIDTRHFLGNHPPFASIEGCSAPSDEALAHASWQELLEPSPLRPGSQNLFAARGGLETRFTHLRLHIYPDGGVARLRVYGDVLPEPDRLSGAQLIDLAALANGARALACSDMFFGNVDNLIMPRSAPNMGDGWETRRRRGPGHDWAVIELAAPGTIEHVVIDTHHFKGNAPDRCALEGALLERSSSLVDIALATDTLPWRPIVEPSPLLPHARHELRGEALVQRGPFTHVRLRIEPDGGVSRLRIYGRVATERDAHD